MAGAEIRCAGDAQELLDWLALAGVAVEATGPWLAATRKAGSPGELLRGGPFLQHACGLGDGAVARLARLEPVERRERVVADCRRLRVGIVSIADPNYPALLREIADPPLVLFYRGVRPARIAPAVAVVGARRSSRYGKRIAAKLAGALARAGFWVVSGMALGIDGVAHEAALAAGRSAAVLAGGAERASPRSHAAIYRRLVDHGGVLSEYRPRTPALPHHFPVRNRIISGMCVAVVVIEAAERSGTIISARLAGEQGRELFAVPGNIDSETSAGANRLLREGATPVLAEAEFIAEAIAVAERFGAVPVASATGIASSAGGENVAGSVSCDPNAARVLAVLDREPMHADAVVAATGLDETRVMALLTALELDGVAERLPAGTFVRTVDLTPR